MNQFGQSSYYDLLEVSASASLEEIQLAFKRAKSTYSPGSTALYTMFSPDEAQQLMLLVEEAYLTLSDFNKRRAYDEQLKFDSEQGIEVFNNQNTSQNNFATQHIESYTDPKSKLNTPINDPELEKEILEQEVFDGSFLQKIREYKGISIVLITDATRIGKHHIKAIESNSFEELPANVFVRNFVRQYAELLGLDANKVADSYMHLVKESRGN